MILLNTIYTYLLLDYTKTGMLNNHFVLVIIIFKYLKNTWVL